MIDRIDRIYGGNPMERKGRGGRVRPSGGGGDQLEVSPFARELSDALKEMQKLPDVRSDKVEEIRSRIEAGTYRPDLDLVAERLVRAGIRKGV
ncbi:flagellar biosynthesis anti-sigma factor FlgM [Thermanaerovibrio acidaminovorans]|uniref:Negative regulator of flagellin synthesis n=1 Tax=Thermanaerovibrio acidaminovorans (strain ATCC 49978 / DSM 6589 / Su883) TaxID=525903 RepID=D1B9E6_THEAS|nr:flagellar biosynthesis anti-sigma factor FlgM [Thermanaerovibrio acidaminovorans]ACZ18899.1 Anti-sigma-28 factor FlgM family protein [Thermanaerovibrio acidaminovorans DSM 6589]